MIFTFLTISTFIGLTFLLATSYFYSKNSPKKIIVEKNNSDISTTEQIKEIVKEKTITNTDILEQKKVIKFPTRLKIPIINVDAFIESLGLVENGDMATPEGPDNVAWYELGTFPGDIGSAVITGHFGTWKNGKGSVFDKLHMLNVGDKIYIEDEKEKTITFIVKKKQIFEPQADASEIFSSDDEKSHLNLITCTGAWNENSKSYSQRLVVFTDRE